MKWLTHEDIPFSDQPEEERKEIAKKIKSLAEIGDMEDTSEAELLLRRDILKSTLDLIEGIYSIPRDGKNQREYVIELKDELMANIQGLENHVSNLRMDILTQKGDSPAVLKKREYEILLKERIIEGLREVYDSPDFLSELKATYQGILEEYGERKRDHELTYLRRDNLPKNERWN